MFQRLPIALAQVNEMKSVKSCSFYIEQKKLLKKYNNTINSI